MFDLNRTISLVTGALFDREATWEAYLPDAGNWQKTAVLLTVPLIVTSAIVAYLLSLVTAGTSFLGSPTLQSTLIGIVVSCLAAAVVAFVFSAVAGVFGGKRNFALGLAAISLAFVPGYVGQALVWLPWIGGLLGLGLGIFSLIQLWKIIPVYLGVPEGKRPAHYIVSFLVAIVIMAIVSRVVGPVIYGDAIESPLGSASSISRSSGLLPDIRRQAEIIEEVSKATYTPPPDGKLDERQVSSFAAIVADVQKQQAERMERLQAIAAEADKDKKLTATDLGSMMSGMKEIQAMNTAQMEAVLAAGGNWAEYQWVSETLRTASLQKTSNEAVVHNYALYQKYADQLSPGPAR